MSRQEAQDKKNKRIGWITSFGVQVLLLILFYFIIAWKEPFPPIPEYGIELGFTTASGAPNTSTSSPQITEETEQEETEEEVEETESLEETTTEPSAEAEASGMLEQVDTPSEVPSPVAVAEEQKVSEEGKDKKEPEVDKRALMQSSNTASNENSEDSSEGEAEQKVDERAIYGSQGTNEGNAEGASLKMAGWVWENEPNPDDNSDVEGKIIFKINVDDQGYIILPVVKEFSNVPPLIVRKYRQAVEKLTFKKTSDNNLTADTSSGTITFIIRSR